MIRLLASLVLLGALCGTAHAQSSCDKPHNDFDGLYCLNKVYQQSDQDLNTAFTALRDKLGADARRVLRTGQLQWLRSRNEECSRREDGAFYVNLECATRMTVARTEFLQQRLRECISAGCMPSKLE